MAVLKSEQIRVDLAGIIIRIYTVLAFLVRVCSRISLSSSTHTGVCYNNI